MKLFKASLEFDNKRSNNKWTLVIIKTWFHKYCPKRGIYSCVFQIPSDCYSNSKAKSWPKFNFPSYGIKAETKCFPLSYNLRKTLGKEPNPQVCCDLPDSNNDHYGGNFVRLACYHTFHVSCLSSHGCCSICKEPLEQLIKNKVSQCNEGLLKNGGTESDGESSDPETEDDTATVVNGETGNANAEQYYTSGLWEQKVNSSLSAIGEIDQPQHPNAQASYAHTQSQSSVVQTSSTVQQLSISPTKSNRITSWHFPPEYSQSTLIGRQDSNACTFIALIYSKLYFSSPEPLDSSRPLSNTWISRVLAASMLGN